MIKHFVQKTLAVLILSLSFFSVTTPTFAQGNLFDSPLDAIEDRLHGEEGETTIDVIDFSESDWGNLPPEIIALLSLEQEGDFESLDQLVQEAGYDQSIGNLNDLVDFILEIDGFFIENDLGERFPNDAANRVINEIRFKGESQLNAVITAVANILRNILGAFAVLWIVVSGIQMVLAQGDETKITEQKRSITYAVAGLVIVLLLERVIAVLYGVPGVERGLDTTNVAFNQEILGLIGYIKFIVGSLAVLMIMVSGFRTITAQGEEDKITEQRKSIIWIVVGIFVIMMNELIINNLYIDPVRAGIQQQTGTEITLTNVQNVINLFGTVMQFILGFVGLLAFGVLIYGAATMIMNYGQDELVEKAKKMIKNALIGIVLILSAFAIVSTVIKFGV